MTQRRVASEGGCLPSLLAKVTRFGPRWNSLREFQSNDVEGLATIELPPEFHSDVATFGTHPALVDVATGCALMVIGDQGVADSLYVPVSYRAIRIESSMPSKVLAHIRIDRTASLSRGDCRCDITITDEEGQTILEISGLTLRRLASVDGWDLTRSRQATGVSSRRTQLNDSERLFLQIYDAGIQADEGIQVLERIVGSQHASQLVVSPIDLAAWMAKTTLASTQARETSVKFERPALDVTFEGPRDETERQLAEIWEGLLGVDQIGIHDNFFDLGGHSLIAVRLFAAIQKKWCVEFPLSILFEAPTIATCADLLRQQASTSCEDQPSPVIPRTTVERSRYLVALNEAPGSAKRPFFLVSGMFGNVLNLRHLGTHLGKDQPVFALQSRGLFGDDVPHESFEEAAEEFLNAIRTIQPRGPYLLGGFSGGGITAFEMTQQLRQHGDEADLLILLDSLPAQPPQPTRVDRLLMQWQHLRNERWHYVSNWARRRREWKQRMREKAMREVTPAEFRSDQIEAAFRRCLQRYVTRPYTGAVHLFRPPFDVFYDLPNGRKLNRHRGVLDAANHWTPFLKGRFEIHLVTGNHDSMVLEPHVRVLGEKLRGVLQTAHAHGSTSGAIVTANDATRHSEQLANGVMEEGIITRG